MIRLAAFQASGGPDMKLHEIQDHFHEVPHAISEYRVQKTDESPSLFELRRGGYRLRRRPRPRLSISIKF
jgi:hypothetical protein